MTDCKFTITMHIDTTEVCIRRYLHTMPNVTF